MKLTYDNIKKFMQDYFKAYTAYAQNPETTHRMYDYFAPDFEFIPYVAGLERFTSRDDFLKKMSAHPSCYETIVPEDIIIDEKRQVVVVLAKADVFDKKTGKVLLSKRYLPRYYLALDKNNTIKIKQVRFFWEVLPPGTPEVHEIFARDDK